MAVSAHAVPQSVSNYWGACSSNNGSLLQDILIILWGRPKKKLVIHTIS